MGQSAGSPLAESGAKERKVPPQGAELVDVTSCGGNELQDADFGSGAKSGAVDASLAPADPRLIALVDAWPALPETVKDAVAKLVTGG